VPAVEHEPDFADMASRFGEKLRHRAHDLNLTQRDIIDLTGISRSYIQSLWNGRGSNREPDGTFKPPNPTMDVIWRLSVALEVDKGYLTDTDREIGDFQVVPRLRP